MLSMKLKSMLWQAVRVCCFLLGCLQPELQPQWASDSWLTFNLHEVQWLCSFTATVPENKLECKHFEPGGAADRHFNISTLKYYLFLTWLSWVNITIYKSMQSVWKSSSEIQPIIISQTLMTKMIGVGFWRSALGEWHLRICSSGDLSLTSLLLTP